MASTWALCVRVECSYNKLGNKLEVKGGCQTDLWRGPFADAPAKYKVSVVDFCCVKFLTAKMN